jgi:uncharacterized protein
MGQDAALAVVRIAALAYLGYLALLFTLQRAVVFPGTHRDPPRPSATSAPPEVSQLWLATGFGRVEAWLLEAPGTGLRPAVVFAHGNGELIDDWVVPMEELRRAGVHVLLVEFPGYGFSDGRPNRGTLRATYLAAFDRLATHPRIDASRIVAMGRSLGAGAASDLALERAAAALVLLSTFTSAGDMAWQGFRVPPFAVRDRFDNRRAVQMFDGPVLVLHGRADDIIPFRHAERLAGLRDGLQVIPLDCAHNDCLAVWPEVAEHVLALIDGLDESAR